MKTLREILTGKNRLDLEKHDLDTAFLKKSIDKMDNEWKRNLLFLFIGAILTFLTTLLSNILNPRPDTETLSKQLIGTNRQHILDSIHIVSLDNQLISVSDSLTFYKSHFSQDTSLTLNTNGQKK